MLMGQQGDTRYAEGYLMYFYCPKKHIPHRVIIPEENVFAWVKKVCCNIFYEGYQRLPNQKFLQCF